ncbi:hypothetical protein HELRODRAFT_181706 [Helobdella robusta]|uniref:Uncharacterized protein n=1 Tax=Helobdella robusta TaxID=6412 RepID=T1FH89_HELRO|nr:hypothetical protein HELRODRAFT_181706 [Helobdella robusta]ESN92090.1 hypothetical protein HELRODRAFT_181706 [Helobdella robusta]
MSTMLERSSCTSSSNPSTIGEIVKFGDVEKEREIEKRLKELGLWHNKVRLEEATCRKLEERIESADGLSHVIRRARRRRRMRELGVEGVRSASLGASDGRICEKNEGMKTMDEIRQIIKPTIIRDEQGNELIYSIEVDMGRFVHDVTHHVSNHVVFLTGATNPLSNDQNSVTSEAEIDRTYKKAPHLSDEHNLSRTKSNFKKGNNYDETLTNIISRPQRLTKEISVQLPNTVDVSQVFITFRQTTFKIKVPFVLDQLNKTHRQQYLNHHQRQHFQQLQKHQLNSEEEKAHNAEHFSNSRCQQEEKEMNKNFVEEQKSIEQQNLLIQRQKNLEEEKLRLRNRHEQLELMIQKEQQPTNYFHKTRSNSNNPSTANVLSRPDENAGSRAKPQQRAGFQLLTSIQPHSPGFAHLSSPIFSSSTPSQKDSSPQIGAIETLTATSSTSTSISTTSTTTSAPTSSITSATAPSFGLNKQTDKSECNVKNNLSELKHQRHRQPQQQQSQPLKSPHQPSLKNESMRENPAYNPANQNIEITTNANDENQLKKVFNQKSISEMKEYFENYNNQEKINIQHQKNKGDDGKSSNDDDDDDRDYESENDKFNFYYGISLNNEDDLKPRTKHEKIFNKFANHANDGSSKKRNDVDTFQMNSNNQRVLGSELRSEKLDSKGSINVRAYHASKFENSTALERRLNKNKVNNDQLDENFDISINHNSKKGLRNKNNSSLFARESDIYSEEKDDVSHISSLNFSLEKLVERNIGWSEKEDDDLKQIPAAAHNIKNKLKKLKVKTNLNKQFCKSITDADGLENEVFESRIQHKLQLDDKTTEVETDSKAAPKKFVNALVGSEDEDSGILICSPMEVDETRLQALLDTLEESRI